MGFSISYSCPSDSQSTSSSASSSNPSPASQYTPLSPYPMGPSRDEPVAKQGPGVTRTAHRAPVDSPHSQSSSRGGCWTCRLRRKKCDESRIDESCQTCLRLKIKCLGWGSKRPEWMRDKQAVEAYKADIKAQLTRAGLIRGQPRSSLIQSTNPVVPSQSRAKSYQDLPAAVGPGPPMTPLEPESSHGNFAFRYHELSSGHRHSLNQTTHQVIPGIPEPSTSSYHGLPTASYSEPRPHLHALDLGVPPPSFTYTSQTSTSLPITAGSSSSLSEAVPFDFSHGVHGVPHFQPGLAAPSPYASLHGQNSIQGEHVLYYFEHVRRKQYIFAGNSVTNVTYQCIVQEPQGPVSNAVCALASLHNTQTRVAQGLEAPELNPENSTARYFQDESYYQLVNAKQVRGRHSDNEIIGALHLVSFALCSGGGTDWEPLLIMACDWLDQIGLSIAENPRLAMSKLSDMGKCAAKLTLWFDIMSSVTLMRPPIHLALYRRLLTGGGYWGSGADLEFDQGLRMETLTGCTDEVLLAIAEVANLAHWKAGELRNGSLSVRELIRRGDDAEQQLRQHHSSPVSYATRDLTPLHPSLPQSPSLTEAGHPIMPFPSENMRRITAKIFHESVILYLHTVLSDSNPGVPEISAAVNNITHLLTQLPRSEADRSIIFPIFLTGCMTNDHGVREMLKRRLQEQEENMANMIQTRGLMEAVWRTRDCNMGVVDWRDTMREQGLKLLLV